MDIVDELRRSRLLGTTRPTDEEIVDGFGDAKDRAAELEEELSSAASGFASLRSGILRLATAKSEEDVRQALSDEFEPVDDTDRIIAGLRGVFAPKEAKDT